MPGGSPQRIQFTHTYESIISVENLLAAWKEFKRGKSKRTDVLEFERYLMQNILKLHDELLIGTYQHGGYHHFKISDPKPRDIHKANVRDRLVHHALYRKLYPFFDRTFIADSYSCRLGKGTHKAMNRFRSFAHTGLPLGNLTSQLLVNIYMNEFDQFVKHTLKAKYYVRYADDFVILSRNRAHLIETLRYIVVFLHDPLKLQLHPKKVSISTLASGVDFLGWVHFPDHRILRTATKRRMFNSLRSNKEKPEVLNSYLGMLSHGNAKKLQKEIC